jgi:hypothetical protein
LINGVVLEIGFEGSRPARKLRSAYAHSLERAPEGGGMSTVIFATLLSCLR